MNELTYKSSGDYLIPDLSVTAAAEPIGRYGRMRRDFLRENRPVLWNSLILSEKLYPQLAEIDAAAQSRLEQLMPALARAAGATETLKASDPMKWTGLMNACREQAEEVILSELIYN